jgi:hypothetical protein
MWAEFSRTFVATIFKLNFTNLPTAFHFLHLSMKGGRVDGYQQISHVSFGGTLEVVGWVLPRF